MREDKKIIVSFIIPIYNAEKFIQSAILSIVEHITFPIEIVLVNDGSTDSSDSICRLLSDNYKEIRYFRTENLGAGHARNYGIKQAQGQWIAFLDSDDLILREFFSTEMLDLLNQAKQSEIDILYFPKILSDYALLTNPTIEMPESKCDIFSNHYIPNLEFWSCIYSTDYLHKEEIRFFEYKKQDVESAFRFRAFSNTKNISVIKTIAFYVHRDNPTSNVNTWKLNTLFYIKSRVFYDLYQEYSRDNDDTKTWLFLQFLYYSKCLLENCILHGADCDEIAELYEVCSLVQTADYRKKIPLRYLMFTNTIKVLISSTVLYGAFTSFISNKRKYKTNSSASSIIELMPDDYTVLRDRLNDYSTIVNEELSNE